MSDGAGTASQLGRDVDVGASEAIMLSNADVGTFTFPTWARIRALNIPRAALAPLLRDPDVLVRAVPPQTVAMQLLVRYFDIASDAELMAAPELAHLAVMHIYDLVALVLGPTRDAAHVAQGRGLRAARLRAIKDDVRGNRLRPGLSIDTVAQRHGVSPRYIQQLFNSEGTTFSEFVCNERLAHAHRMLTSPLFATTAVSTIAYDSGFGDLSYFNRAFHRRFGMSPSEIRAAALSRQPAS
jgi:AraC-like DNA-binding protein